MKTAWAKVTLRKRENRRGGHPFFQIFWNIGTLTYLFIKLSISISNKNKHLPFSYLAKTLFHMSNYFWNNAGTTGTRLEQALTRYLTNLTYKYRSATIGTLVVRLVCAASLRTNSRLLESVTTQYEVYKLWLSD